MDKLRSKGGTLAAWVGRPMPWLQATVARGPTSEDGHQTGQGLAEYALILALITILAVGAVAFVGGDIIGLLTDTVGTGFRYVVSLISSP